MTVDASALASLLAERLNVSAVRLSALQVRCAWPVFRATAENRAPLFVKVVDCEAAERTRAFLSAVVSPFFPRLELEPFAFSGCAVLCLEWKAAKSVNAEDMSDAQLDSFAEGCRQLASVLSGYRGEVVAPDEDSPGRQYAAIADYVRRHPLAGRLLRPLVSLPEGARSYARRPLSVIHGDFQPRNYGFDGERLAAVFDFDALTLGLPCEDAAYAFTERARRAELSAASRKRLTELFLRLVTLSPWPAGEWRIAVSHARLRIASRRLEKHPDSPFVALDIRRRDRPLARLAAALEKAHA